MGVLLIGEQEVVTIPWGGEAVMQNSANTVFLPEILVAEASARTKSHPHGIAVVLFSPSHPVAVTIPKLKKKTPTPFVGFGV